MTQPAPFDDGADRVERVEHRWAAVSVVIVVLLVVVATLAGLHQGAMPQSRVETVDPRTLHLGGEFIESNLGSAVELDGSITCAGSVSNTRSRRPALSCRPMRRSHSAQPAPTWCTAS
jgi:hypothetical protein